MNDTPVTRSEFETAMRRLESVIEKNTEILQQLAISQVESRNRDERVQTLTKKVEKLQEQLDKQGQQQSRWAGGLVVLAAAWPVVAKKLGFM